MGWETERTSYKDKPKGDGWEPFGCTNDWIMWRRQVEETVNPDQPKVDFREAYSGAIRRQAQDDKSREAYDEGFRAGVEKQTKALAEELCEEFGLAPGQSFEKVVELLRALLNHSVGESTTQAYYDKGYAKGHEKGKHDTLQGCLGELCKRCHIPGEPDFPEAIHAIQMLLEHETNLSWREWATKFITNTIGVSSMELRERLSAQLEERVRFKGDLHVAQNQFKAMEGQRDVLLKRMVAQENDLDTSREWRAANWIPNGLSLRSFVRDAPGSEVCARCNKHLSQHYGGVEYRCDPRD